MSRQHVTIKAPAKINFGLSIGARKADGYHSISTILIPISLYDTVHLKITGKSGITLNCADTDSAGEELNLCWKAAKLFLDEVKPDCGITITLEKNIPVGSGLGGGSSNAAAVLTGLSKIFRRPLSAARLSEMALSLGADVPFFLNATPCTATGIGEILQPVNFPWKCDVLLVVPSFSISTTAAYSAFDRENSGHPEAADLSQALSSMHSLADARSSIKNEFEPVLFSQYPGLPAIKQTVLDSGADYASLTGSGSVIYGLFTDHWKALAAYKSMSESIKTELVSAIIDNEL